MLAFSVFFFYLIRFRSGKLPGSSFNELLVLLMSEGVFTVAEWGMGSVKFGAALHTLSI